MTRLLLLAVLAARPLPAAEPAAARANVVLVTLDAVRADRVGSRRGGASVTPVIDALAARGALFEAAYAQAPWTIPSLASLMTSSYAEDHRAVLPHPRLDPAIPTLASTLRSAGYRTAAFVAGAPSDSKVGLTAAFETVADFGTRTADMAALVARAEAWIAARGSAPYFIWIHAFNTHLPFACPEPFRDQYDPGYDGPLHRLGPEMNPGGLASASLAGVSKFIYHYNGYALSRRKTPHYPLDEALLARVSAIRESPADVAHLNAHFDGCLNYSDAQIGRLQRFIEARPAPGRTLWVVSADHGTYLGSAAWSEEPRISHPFGDLHEELLRVPLVISGAAGPSRRVATPVRSIDVAPTVLAAAGVAAPAAMRGRDLFAVSPAPRSEAAVYSSDYDSDESRWVRALQAERWKLVRSTDAWRLYDLRNDPGERADLSRSRPLEFLKAAGALLEHGSNADVMKKLYNKKTMFTSPRRLAPLLLLLAVLPASASPRLYWFVPDGLRADPAVFDVFGWAQAGKLPNIKKMMDEGAWGYSMPAFPSHTPSNFATLMTGTYPEVHGVADGPMRVEGFPLLKPSVSGFSSTAKKTAPIWVTLEKAGRKVALVSIPGSTPPELNAGATVRGRWGNWGADFHALNFQSAASEDPRSARGLGSRLFYLGPELTRDAPLVDGRMAMLAYGATVYARLDKAAVSFSFDGKTELARLSSSNEWSEWLPITLQWQGQPIETRVRLCLIKRSAGYIKVRLLYDVLNRTIVSPPEIADALEGSVGPMVDFPDNWPAQLNRLPEERAVMLSEAKMALDWHRRAAGRLLSVEKPDVLIQDTYVPNQMLESRWWLKHLDPESPDYAATQPADREQRRAEIFEIYRGIDAVLGEAIKSAGPDTVIALSSDHGILAIKKEVLVNNLLAREGLLVFDVDPKTGEPAIDWVKSKAAFLKMIGVYVNPAGLSGPWTRAKGPEYDALRARVTALLSGLEDGGAPVVDRVVPWERASELRLPKDRVPDLILAMKPGYALTEDMDKSGEILRASRQSGYKQAVPSDGVPALWTPFVVMGPGVKKGFRLERPINNADQAPTFLRLLGVPAPPETQGRVIKEMLQ